MILKQEKDFSMALVWKCLSSLTFLIFSFHHIQVKSVEIISSGEILAELYKQARFVAISGADHTERLLWKRYVSEYFNHFGLDPNFKYVFVENSADQRELFEYLVEPEVNQREALARFGVPLETLEGAELNYQTGELVDLVRALNKLRPKNNPISIIPIDEVPSRNRTMASWGLEMSTQREQGTARNFSEIAKQTAPEARGLIIYHMAHTTRGIKVGLLDLQARRTGWAPGGWVQHLPHHIREQVATVIIDHQSRTFNPNGVFDLGPLFENGVIPRNGAGFLTEPIPMDGIIFSGNILKDSFYHTYMRGAMFPAYLDQLFDAVIFERSELSEFLKLTCKNFL